MYGDNGSGKTTLLNLIFWLLSSKNGSGYKTKIAKTKFNSISIRFQNEIEIGALREGNSIEGSYTYYVKDKSKIIHSLKFKETQDKSISLEPNSKESKIYSQILQFIKDLKITVFYLSDDRKILDSISSSDNAIERNSNLNFNEQDINFSRDYEKVAIRRLMNEKKSAIDPAIEKLLEWVRIKVISGSKTGEKNSQVIFTDLIKNIFTPNKVINETKSKEELIAEIEKVETRVNPYISLGLIETFDSETIITTINLSKNNTQLNNLRSILAPYIESINAKLEALEKIKNILNLFLGSINSYFTNKEISFNLNYGFKLKQKGGDEIEFEFLSSGEKQLLLLFINTITSAEVATIFIIDEPEISLNIKWQRQLVETLLEFSDEKNIQYILSTHSLELLSSNIENVTKLQDIHGIEKEV